MVRGVGFLADGGSVSAGLTDAEVAAIVTEMETAERACQRAHQRLFAAGEQRWGNATAEIAVERAIDGVALAAARLRDAMAKHSRGLTYVERVRRALGYNPLRSGRRW